MQFSKMMRTIFFFVFVFGGFLVTANTIVIVKTDEDLKTVLTDLEDPKQDDLPIKNFENNGNFLMNQGVDKKYDEYPVGLVDDDQGLDFDKEQGLDFDKEPGLNFDKKQGLDLYGDDEKLWFENGGGLDFNPEQSLDFNKEQGLDFDKEPGLDFDKKQGLDLYGDDEKLWFENGGGLDFNPEQSLDFNKEQGLDFDKEQGLDLYGDDEKLWFENGGGLDFNPNQDLSINEDQGLDFNKEQGLINFEEEQNYYDGDPKLDLDDYEEQDYEYGGLFDSQSDEDSFLLDLYGNPNKIKDTNKEDILKTIQRAEFVICGVVFGLISILIFSVLISVWLMKNRSKGSYTKLSSVEDDSEIVIYSPEKPVK